MCLLTIVFTNHSCDSKSNDIELKLENYLNSKYKSLKGKKAIFILSDKGCLACNRSYSSFLNNYSNDRNYLIVNLSKGSQINISNFLDADNVVNDFNGDISEYISVEGSQVILLRNNIIDTVLNVKASNWVSGMKFLENELDLIDSGF